MSTVPPHTVAAPVVIETMREREILFLHMASDLGLIEIGIDPGTQDAVFWPTPCACPTEH